MAQTHKAHFRAPEIQLQKLELKQAACGELCSVAVTEPAAWSQCSCFLELFGLLCVLGVTGEAALINPLKINN